MYQLRICPNLFHLFRPFTLESIAVSSFRHVSCARKMPLCASKSNLWNVNVTPLRLLSSPSQHTNYSTLPVEAARTVKANIGDVSDLNIKCISLIDSPNQDLAKFNFENGLFEICKTEHDTLELKRIGSNAECVTQQANIEIPIYFNVDVDVTGSRSVGVSRLENARVAIKTEQGDCSLHYIQTAGPVDLRTQGGSIECTKLVQGNIMMKTRGNGCIKTDRLQGHTLEVSSEAGDINLGAVYTKSSQIRTLQGSINVHHCHGRTDMTVLEKGNVTLGSVSGDLKLNVNEGDVDVLLAEPGDINISAQKGNVNIRVLESVSLGININSSVCDVDPSLTLKKHEVLENTTSSVTGMLTPVEKSTSIDQCTGKLTVNASSGRVHIQCVDWITAMGLSVG